MGVWWAYTHPLKLKLKEIILRVGDKFLFCDMHERFPQFEGRVYTIINNHYGIGLSRFKTSRRSWNGRIDVRDNNNITPLEFRRMTGSGYADCFIPLNHTEVTN